jgi:hypothetical protein
MEKRYGAKPGTNLGELIAAAGEVAFEYSNNDKEAYDLARLALIEILRKTSQAIDLDKDFETLSSSGQVIHWHLRIVRNLLGEPLGSPFYLPLSGNFGWSLSVLSRDRNQIIMPTIQLVVSPNSQPF